MREDEAETNLPATADAVAAGNILKAATSGRAPILKFKKGVYYYLGAEEAPQFVGRDFIAYCGDWRRGWRKWRDDEVIEDRVVRVADDASLPCERDDLGDVDESDWPVVDGEARDPWCCENQLPLEDAETGERYLFSTPSTGGKIAVEGLCGRYAANIRKGLNKGLPIIRLGVGTFNTKKFKNTPRPDFKIVGWENDGDDNDLVDVTPRNPRGGISDEIPY